MKGQYQRNCYILLFSQSIFHFKMLLDRQTWAIIILSPVYTFLIRLTMARNQRKQCEKPGSKFAQCISRGRCGIMDLHFQLTSEVLWQTY